MDKAERAEAVGPVLEAGDLADAIVDAIREQNPTVEVEDRGSYLRVLVPGRCVLERAAVERRTGKQFQLPGDLEQVMPSFKGRLSLTGDQAIWVLGEGGAES